MQQGWGLIGQPILLILNPWTILYGGYFKKYVFKTPQQSLDALRKVISVEISGISLSTIRSVFLLSLLLFTIFLLSLLKLLN